MVRILKWLEGRTTSLKMPIRHREMQNSKRLKPRLPIQLTVFSTFLPCHLQPSPSILPHSFLFLHPPPHSSRALLTLPLLLPPFLPLLGVQAFGVSHSDTAGVAPSQTNTHTHTHRGHTCIYSIQCTVHMLMQTNLQIVEKNIHSHTQTHGDFPDKQWIT